jgi:hypothetical protein
MTALRADALAKGDAAAKKAAATPTAPVSAHRLPEGRG